MLTWTYTPQNSIVGDLPSYGICLFSSWGIIHHVSVLPLFFLSSYADVWVLKPAWPLLRHCSQQLWFVSCLLHCPHSTIRSYHCWLFKIGVKSKWQYSVRKNITRASVDLQGIVNPKIELSPIYSPPHFRCRLLVTFSNLHSHPEVLQTERLPPSGR